ncbi:uncharacterized protein C17orf80 homolog [Dunckerocampus dactyliophorus]|uniref:uncharacterized protein C17orf80 homolog n=1 Tax=Dunckerocampus dactyliophorus TaxID=161453 RepID=UPI002404A232|nr:uncharacterized protein C17orf80 homolog [Dunckerocampus dactyliophorus]
MSTEVCPFCGNSYKRLKSHLPHCKEAAKQPLTPDAPAASQTSNSLDADWPQKKGTKSSTLKKKVSVPPEVPEKNVKSTPPSSSSLKKQKLSEQIKMALVSSPASPASSSRPKKKSIRTSVEAPKPSQFSFVQSDPHRSTKSAYKPDKDRSDIPSPEPKAKSASKKKRSQIQSTAPLEVERVDLYDERSQEGSGGSLSRITLQHVGSPLGRTKSSGPTIQIQTHSPDLQRSHAHVSATLQAKALAAPKQASSTLTSHKTAPLTDLQPSQVSQVTPPPRTVNSLMEGLRHRAELPSAFLGHFSGPPSRAENALMTQRKTENCSGRGFGQVMLRELPGWLAFRTPCRPKDVVEMMQRGWGWYYRKYIDVRKGGIGGVGMLLAGYCVLSYIWSYPHLKRDRWRKYH